MAAPAERMRLMRARRQKQGLREVRLLVPDTRRESVRREIALQVRRLDAEVEADAVRWNEAVSIFDDADSEDASTIHSLQEQ